MNRFSKIAATTIIWLAIFAAYVVLLRLLGITCPILHFIGIRCPTCGVSRALAALTKLDFSGYFSYNPFAVPLVIAVWLILNKENFRRRRCAVVVAAVLLSTNFVYYLWSIVYD